MTTRTTADLAADNDRLLAENLRLRARFEDAQATLDAVRAGEVDAVVVYANEGEKVYTLEGADRPYRLLIEAMQQGAAIVDGTGQVLYGNLHLAALLGRPLEQVIGAPLTEVVPQHARARFVQLLSGLALGTTAREEFLLAGSGGRMVSVEVAVQSLPLLDLRSVIVTDLTRQRQYEELVETKRRLDLSEAEHRRLYAEVKEADRRKDEFLAMLAQELRNPLAPIRNALHILKVEGDPAMVVQAREIMERQTQNIVRVVNDLLDVSQIMSGKIELHRSVVEISQVLEHAMEIVRPTLEAQQQRLTVSVPQQPVRVDVDPVRMGQAIGNLLANAAKYTGHGGTITLTVELEGASAVFRVRDSGIGIAPNVLPHIFELFVQADPALNRVQGGLGIGLTLVRRLVEMHGGGVSAFSDGPGSGSEFVVRLPASFADALRPAATKPGRKPRGTSARRVLVVDDNPDTADSTATLLRLWGHEVQLAYEGVSAIDIALRFKPNVVLLDIGLPGMNGYEVAAHLRRGLGDKTVLVAMTGYGQDEDRRRSQEAGFDLHLTKPLEPSLLEAFVASV